MRWLTTYKIPLGEWIRALVDLLNQYAAGFFDLISNGLGFLIEGVIDLMKFCPPMGLVLFFTILTYWLHRSFKLGCMVFLSLLLIINLGYWEQTVETIVLVLFSTLICILVGVPVGIASAHNPKFHTILRPVLDLMQTIPTFVYLIPTLILFGLGVVPGLISTVIFAIPAPIRLTHLGVSTVPANLIEAGKAFGATKWQLLWKVELPSAKPSIMAGLTQCIMLSLSMVVSTLR